MLTQHFSDEEIKEAFNTFDINGDGYINAAEIYAIMQLLGENPEDDVVDEMLNMFDSSGDGQIKWQEFYSKITGHVLRGLM